mmetsp:Transcript_950/g.1302  ORF Transcript_950/g.1302 Transcript_950/m.1302 type:complete len:276 (+) Transcript_950:530-1357(+)
MLFVLVVLSLVALAVRPDELAVAVHLVVRPHALVAATVTPLVAPLSLNVVFHELAMVLVAVGPGELALPLLHPLHVVALELAPVGPALHSAAILSVVLPKAAVKRAVLVVVEADAVRFIVQPLTLVDVAIFVKQASVLISFIVLPVAFVEAAIGPDLDATAFARVAVLAPLAHVDCAVLEQHGFAGFALFKPHQVLALLTQVLEWPVPHQHPLDVEDVSLLEVFRQHCQVVFDSVSALPVPPYSLLQAHDQTDVLAVIKLPAYHLRLARLKGPDF